MLECDAETLRFRRQFALGERALSGFTSWRHVAVGENLCLTAHPEVEIAQATCGDHHLLAIGLLVDTDCPEASLSAVANGLLDRLKAARTLDAFAPALRAMAGRWALVARRGAEIRVFHDAAGTRQLFYAPPLSDDASRWCASSPDLLAEVFDLAVCPAVREILTSEDFARQREYWWPGNRTPYEEIRRLPPNHYLDFSVGQAHRYDPPPGLQTLALEEAVAKAAQLLRAAMHGVAARHPLAISLTAGFDSRVSFAAAVGIDPLLSFSFVHEKIRSNHPDIVIPSRLASRFGTRHESFACPHRADATFAAAYRTSNPLGNPTWAAVAAGLFEHLPPDVVRVTSTVSEIGRVFYPRASVASEHTLDGEALATLTRLGSHPWVVDAFDEWLRSTALGGSIHPLDLFYWEQRLGSWAGTLFREWDIAHEGFSPFSCRALMETFLAVAERDRAGPSHRLHLALIRALCPEALAEPINPPAPGRWLKRIRKIGARRVRNWLVGGRSRDEG